MRKASMPAAVWCVAVVAISVLLAAFCIAYYTVCPCCWPFDIKQDRCRVAVPEEDPYCLSPPCVRKCCSENEELFRDENMTSSQCRPSDSLNFTLTVVPLWMNDSLVNNTLERDYDRYSLVSFGLCPNGFYDLDPTNIYEQSALLQDGYLLMVHSKRAVDRNNYCIDYHNNLQATKVFRCFPLPKVEGMTEMEKQVFPLSLTVSIPFLLATVFVYLILPELQNLHGKSLLCHVSSLSVAYTFLVLIQINFLDMNLENFTLCVVSAFVIQFSFLATFFWLNIMCFDIWWVFSGLRPLRGSVKEREHKKFIFYSLYAWGCPLIIFIISLVMELVPSIPDTFIKPQFGFDKCWFRNTDALVLYFYLPIGVIVILNIVMFMTTAFRLRAHTRETKVLQSSESRRNDEAERQRFNLYLKLFVVMGINWVMELVSFIIGGPKSIWFVTDVGNTLQGLLIFLIFVWKRRILRMLNQKLCPRWELVAATTTSGRSKVSPSRTSSSTVSKTASNNPDVLALKPIAHVASEESDSNN